MPRKSRIDAPDTLDHIIISRGLGSPMKKHVKGKDYSPRPGSPSESQWTTRQSPMRAHRHTGRWDTGRAIKSQGPVCSSLRRVLVRKGLLTNEEVLEEVNVVRRELEGKRAR